MLPAALRLPAKQIPLLAKTGKRLWFDGLEMHANYLQNNFRAAIVVPVKTEKLASKRNTIKRKLRAAIIVLYKQELLPRGDYLILVRDKEIITKEIAGMLKRMWQIN